MKIASLFSGCGGLDLGFKNAGFEIVYANEYDKDIHATYEHNHPETPLDKRSIIDVNADDIPDVAGIIGGPPCQAWSMAGNHKGIEDPRGQLFYEYIRILDAKKPLFFIIENVQGLLCKTHKDALENILNALQNAGNGYDVSYKLLTASHYGVPQSRKRVFFVGFDKTKNNKAFAFPEPTTADNEPCLRECIGDLVDKTVASKNKIDGELDNAYFTGAFRHRFNSRNRLRRWNQPSYTILASMPDIVLHPDCLVKEREHEHEFIISAYPNNEYRRLTVRECARIQSFPDNFVFKTDRMNAAFKMIGNAVPPKLANAVANAVIDHIVI